MPGVRTSKCARALGEAALRLREQDKDTGSGRGFLEVFAASRSSFGNGICNPGVDAPAGRSQAQRTVVAPSRDYPQMRSHGLTSAVSGSIC